MTPVFLSRRIHTAVGWLMVAATTALSLTPTASLPPVTGGINDKLGHACLYATLMLWFALITRRPRWFALAAAIVVFGAALEIAQGFVPTRTPSIVDAIANTCGVAAGALLGHVIVTGLRNAGRAE